MPPYATEHLGGDVYYYEETTYNLWNVRLSSQGNKEPTNQPIKRPESIVCHVFNRNGDETFITRYVQRDSNVGSIGRDENGNINFIANEISRSTPDTRTVLSYGEQNRLLSRKVWSFNAGDSLIAISDSCIYDSTGTLSCFMMTRDSISIIGRYSGTGRSSGWNITYSDGTTEEYRYDSDRNLTRYKDRDGMTLKNTYNERGHIIKQTSEWEDGSILNVIFEDFEYDDNGNWTRCIRKVKDPGESPKSTKIIERTILYR